MFFAFFIVFIMVSSIFAFVFLIAPPQKNEPVPSPMPSEPVTGIAFEAQSIPAKVSRLFPQIIITSPTNNAQIDQIDSELRKISGILQIVDSRYLTESQSAQQGINLVYFAQASIANDANVFLLEEKISQISFIQGTQIARIGLVSLPSSVVFQNPDLNITQTHSFTTPFSNAILSNQTIADDNISVLLQASLSGNTLVSIQAIEEQNFSAMPVQFSLNEQFLPVSFGPTISASFVADYNFLGQEEQLDTELSLLFPQATPRTSIDFFVPSLEIIFDKNYAVFQPDLEFVLKDQNGIQAHFFDFDQNKITVILDVKNFATTKQKLVQELESLKFKVVNTIDPEIPVTSQLSFLSSNLQDEPLNFKEFLEQKQFMKIFLSRPAFFEKESFLIPDTNQTIDFAQKQFQAPVSPFHLLSDQIKIDIVLTLARGQLVSVTATETLQ